MKVGNIVPRAGMVPTSLVFQASVLLLHHVGSLIFKSYARNLPFQNPKSIWSQGFWVSYCESVPVCGLRINHVYVHFQKRMLFIQKIHPRVDKFYVPQPTAQYINPQNTYSICRAVDWK